MNMEQKTAWLILILFPLTCIGFLVISSIGGYQAAFSVFSLYGLVGLSPFILRRRFDLTKIYAEEHDERDDQIRQRANVAGAGTSYLVFVAGLMGIWAANWYAGREMVPVSLLPLVVLCGYLSFTVIRSAVLLILYRRGSGCAE